MKSHLIISALSLAGLSVVSGCASGPQQTSTPYASTAYPASQNYYGRVESIQPVASNSHSAAGAVVGGLVGALVGNQIGGGSGRTIATVAGAVGGAVVGNNVQENRESRGTDQVRITVRMENGEDMSFIQSNAGQLSRGQRVRVVDGHVYSNEN